MNIHFLTFASSNWVNSPLRYREDLEKINSSSKFFKSYSIWNENDLNQEYHDRFSNYFSDHGFAYFSWKPYCIRQKLMQVEEDDWLVYLDSGCVLPMDNIDCFCNDIRSSVEHMMSNGINIGLSTYIDKNPNIRISNVGIVRLEILRKFELETSMEFLFDFPHYQAGLVIIRKCDEAIELLNSWYKFFDDNYESAIRSDYNDRNGQYKGFIHNGSDQAVLQCILFKNKVNVEITNFYYKYNVIQHMIG